MITLSKNCRCVVQCLFVLVMAACSLGRPAEEEVVTATTVVSQAPTDWPVPVTAEVPVSEVIVFASPLPSFTPLPASATPSPLPTPGPFEHEIQAGDTLGYIIRQYGYRSTDGYVMDLVVELNANVPNVNTLPGPGSVILIPLPTATPVPIGVEMTATADAELGTITRGGITLAAGAELICHEVRGGETIIDVSARYGMTVELIAKLNRNIDFSGCDLTQPGGGGGCNPFISVGQCVTVAGPTPIPTFTPTPSGSETPTPVPTPQPPRIIAPKDGESFPTGSTPMLYWWSMPLLSEEFYLVVMYEAENALEISRTIRASAIGLPSEFAPPPGEVRNITWSVRIVRRTEDETYAFVSEFAPTRGLRWEGN